MTFANPQFLWFLLLVPVVLLYGFRLRKDDHAGLRFSSVSRFSNIPRVSSYFWSDTILTVLRALALTLLIVALARPQKGLKSEETTTKATDIMICLDASRSMLSVDFKPDNRFQVAKNTIAEFIRGREHDRIGVVLFAEHAITQSPLTTDHEAILSILDTLEVGAIPADQTAIGVGLATSVNRIKKSEAKSKVIILVTDGSNNAGVIDPVTAAKTAAAYGIKIYTIGAGSPEGGLMPVDDPLVGRRLIRTENDLDEDLLLKVAGLTGGKYFRAKSPNGLKTIFNEIDKLEKTDIKVRQYIDYEEFYAGFLLWAALLLGVEFSIRKTALRTNP